MLVRSRGNITIPGLWRARESVRVFVCICCIDNAYSAIHYHLTPTWCIIYCHSHRWVSSKLKPASLECLDRKWNWFGLLFLFVDDLILSCISKYITILTPHVFISRWFYKRTQTLLLFILFIWRRGGFCLHCAGCLWEWLGFWRTSLSQQRFQGLHWRPSKF